MRDDGNFHLLGVISYAVEKVKIGETDGMRE